MERDTVRSLHDQAMVCAQKHMVEYHTNGYSDKTIELATQALELELKAIDVLEQACADIVKAEPTRSILYASAAHLATQAGQRKKAIELANNGLDGMPNDHTKGSLLEAKNLALWMEE